MLALLRPVARLAVTLALANVALAAAQFVEPVLFGHIVDALSGALPAGLHDAAWTLAPLIGIWVGFGLFVIVAATLVAWYADRLSHYRRNMVLADYFEHVLQLPLAYHSGAHSGRQMKVMLTGTDTLWWLWLSFFREHLSAFVFVVLLLPASLVLNWRLALPLIALCAAFTVLTAFVIHKSFALQRAVERHYSDLAETAADALGNVALVQSYARVELEVSGLRMVVDLLLRAQMPVLSWWALATVLTRAGTTLTLLVILLTGVYLKLVGLASVGQIVSFMAMAAMLITRLEQAVGFSNRLFMDRRSSPTFSACSIPRPRARPAGRRRYRPRTGLVEFESVSFAYDGMQSAVNTSASRSCPASGSLWSARPAAANHRARAIVPRVGSASGSRRGRRRRYPPPQARGAPSQYRRGVPGNAAVQPLDRRQSARRQAGRDRRELRRRRRVEALDFIIAIPMAGSPGRRARRAPLRRRAAAAGDSPRTPQKSADPDPRRSNKRARSGHRGAGQSGARRSDEGPHDFRHRPPAGDHRDATRILVFRAGRIVETGTFEELYRRGGAFAELVEAQFGIAKAVAERG